jgi:predicted enzyme related to lactoylglutathione lyase
MSELNSIHNRAVWFDIPVADLDRAAAFYRGVLGIKVEKAQFDQFSFCVLEHGDGNGGCLVPGADQVSAKQGILLYLNVNGRIRDATRRVEALGGKLIEPTHAIGPHGFRAIALDSEGNRIALHSAVDA